MRDRNRGAAALLPAGQVDEELQRVLAMPSIAVQLLTAAAENLTTHHPVTGRRVIAVGIIRHRAGRTTVVRATPAGVTGRITRAQDDACPICCLWACICTPWPGHHPTAAGAR